MQVETEQTLDAFRRGQDAAESELERGQNPYLHDDPLHRFWDLAWTAYIDMHELRRMHNKIMRLQGIITEQQQTINVLQQQQQSVQEARTEAWWAARDAQNNGYAQAVRGDDLNFPYDDIVFDSLWTFGWRLGTEERNYERLKQACNKACAERDTLAAANADLEAKVAVLQQIIQGHEQYRALAHGAYGDLEAKLTEVYDRFDVPEHERE